jgi:hypothetical protein
MIIPPWDHLSHPAEIGMVELRLASIALSERAKQFDHRVRADPVTLGDLGCNAKPFGRQVLHSRSVPGEFGRITAYSREHAPEQRDL